MNASRPLAKRARESVVKGPITTLVNTPELLPDVAVAAIASYRRQKEVGDFITFLLEALERNSNWLNNVVSKQANFRCALMTGSGPNRFQIQEMIYPSNKDDIRLDVELTDTDDYDKVAFAAIIKLNNAEIEGLLKYIKTRMYDNPILKEDLLKGKAMGISFAIMRPFTDKQYRIIERVVVGREPVKEVEPATKKRRREDRSLAETILRKTRRSEEELFLTTCSEEEEKVEKEMDQHKPENTSSDNNQNKAIAKENIIKLASSSCSSIQASKSNVYLENKMRIDKSNTNKNDDSSSMSGHVSRAHFINLMKLNEVNSADDVSSKLSPCKSRIPWQNISQLPAIQSMTSYLMKTCHNYRQTMKAVISSKQSCDDPGSSKMTKLIFKDIHSQTDDQQVSFKIHEAHSKKKYETRNNSVTFHDYKDVGKVDKAVGDGSVKRRGFSFGTGDGMSALSMSAGPSPLKRKRGRPPKAGPSKKFKCNCTDGFYIGKLSNVCRHQAGDC